MSQQELADAAGVARQTIGGMEAELYAPSAAVALKLARALGCTVEELFWLESERDTLTAVAAASVPVDTEVRVALARVGDRWVAHSLEGENAFRMEMAPADAIGTRRSGSDTITVGLVDDAKELARTVVIAGCSPVISVWARSAERWFPGLRVQWISANSTKSIHMLAAGEVHAAGVHLFNPGTGECNLPFVRHILGEKSAVLISLGVWEEGLLVQRGNPRAINHIEDISQRGFRIVNREKGSGSRTLLDSLLLAENVAVESICGYDDVVTTHQEAARQVSSGAADAAMSTASIASAYQLDFVPFARVRYDLALLEVYLEQDPVKQLLSTLQHRWVRQQLALLGGYDVSLAGEVTPVS
jgi:molybdate-binding protein/DNA-binding XRE family transcriptional regulator